MFFPWNQSLDIIYPNEENAFMVPTHEKKKEIILWIYVYPIEKQTLILKMVEGDVFFWNQRLNIINPKGGNAFMMPYHEKKGDYYANPCLSKSIDIH